MDQTSHSPQQPISIDAKAFNKIQQHFIHLIAHRLRAPLTAIRGASEIINTSDIQKMDKTDLTKLLDIINDQARESLEQLALVVDAVDSTDEKLMIQKIKGDLSALIKKRVNLYIRRAALKDINITVNIPSSFPSIEFDPMRITQVIDNLLLNSIKATARGGSISIDMKADNSTISILVKDTGVGISEEKQKTLFQGPTESLLSLVKNTSGQPNSISLGLYLTKIILERHNGTISLVSEVNKGTTVTCIIPYSQDLLPTPHDMLLNS